MRKGALEGENIKEADEGEEATSLPELLSEKDMPVSAHEPSKVPPRPEFVQQLGSEKTPLPLVPEPEHRKVPGLCR